MVVFPVCTNGARLATSATENKKADVAEHPEVFHHVGLLFNGSSAAAGYPLFSHPTSLQSAAILRRCFANYNDQITRPPAPPIAE